MMKLLLSKSDDSYVYFSHIVAFVPVWCTLLKLTVL